MPHKPLHPCRHAGCNALTVERYCQQHNQHVHPDKRQNANARGYTYRWQKESKAYLARHPWCAVCEHQDQREPATEVDHIVPHKGNKSLFWDRTNWQGLCHSCHSTKTAREDGGFGNA